MKTKGTYFESIDHDTVAERISTHIIIKPSFFEESGMGPIHLYMDSTFGLRPKELQHPNIIVYIGNENQIVGQPIARISLLKPYYYNIWQQTMDRVGGKLDLLEEDANDIDRIMQASASIIQNPIIDVDKYDLTVYQYILFIYNTGVINLTPTRATRRNRFEDKDYILDINSKNIESVTNRFTNSAFSINKPIPMDYPMPDYSKLTRVRVEEIDD